MITRLTSQESRRYDYTLILPDTLNYTTPRGTILAKDQMEALGMLAASLHGRMESVMEAHGATIGTLRGLYQSSQWMTDVRPVALRNGHYLPRLVDKGVPGIATVIDDVVEGFEDAVR